MVEIKLSALKESKPHEYLVRFLFGGAATVLAGLVARRFGPAAGGLFLAFPAIFPASVTLIESHEKERKGELGYNGTNRGRMAASIDAAGATLGSVGLIGFAIVLIWLLPRRKSLAGDSGRDPRLVCHFFLAVGTSQASPSSAAVLIAPRHTIRRLTAPAPL